MRFSAGTAEDPRDVRVTFARTGAANLAGAARPTPEVLNRLYLPGAASAAPLRQVVDLRLEPSPSRFYRTDAGSRSVE